MSAICAGLAAAGLSVQANALSALVGDTGYVTVGPNSKLQVIGGATTDLSDNNNIGVTAINNNSNIRTFTIKLAKNITGLTSVQTDSVNVGYNVLNGAGLTAGNTFVSSDGLNFVANNGTSEVAVTNTGINAGRFVVNGVADGAVGDNSLQAVNGHQLFETESRVTENRVISQGNMTALGGTYDSAANSGAAGYVAPTYDIVSNPTNVATTSFTTVKGAVEQLSSAVQTPLTFAGDNGTAIARQLGDQLKIRGASTVANNAATTNISVTADGTDTLSVKLAENINLGANGSVRMGTTTGSGNVSTAVNGTGVSVVERGLFSGSTRSSATLNNNDLTFTSSVFGQSGFGTATLNSNGLNIAGGPQFTRNSINASGNKITNVQNGTIALNNKDAVNGGQLFNNAQSVANNFGGSSTVNADGTVSAPSYTLNGVTNAATNVGAALTNIDDRVITNTSAISDLANGVTGLVQQNPTGTGGITVGAATGGTSVSFAGTEGDRVLTGVANGVVAAGSNDAVIGDQLFAQGTGVAGIIGVGTTYDPATGTFTNADIGGTGQSTINDAIGSNRADIDALKNGTAGVVREGTAATNNEGALSVGSTASATGENSIAMGVNAKAIGKSSISIGTGNQVFGDNSGAFGDPTIINGANSYAVGNDNTLDGDRAFILGNDNKINAGSNDSSIIGNNNEIQGQRSLALGKGNTIRSTDAFALGNGISIGENLDGAVGIGNGTTVEASTVASFGLGLTGVGPIIGTATGSNVVSVGSEDGERRLTNLAAGGADTDAVNVSQLRAVNRKVNTQGANTAAALGGTAAYDEASGAISAPKYILNNGQNVFDNVGGALSNLDGRTISNTNNIASIASNTAANTSNIATNATNINRNTSAIGDLASGRTGMVQQNPTSTGDITVGAATGGTEVSFAGTQGDRVLTNVADGMAPRDAVNFGQLNGMERRLGNSINELGYRIDDVEDDANAGISAAMAMSSLPQSSIAGRSMIGGGIATYNGESAVAVGISRVSDNGRWVMKVNGTADTQGNAGGAIGAGFHF